MSIKVKEILEEELPLVRVDRRFDLSPGELWRWLTDPDRTAQWIGPWRPLAGDQIEITWLREEGTPTESARVLEVNAPHGYTLELGSTEDPWTVLVTVLALADGQSEFTLIQPSADPAMHPAIQAGWSYYADCLAAAVHGRAFPVFEDYWKPEN